MVCDLGCAAVNRQEYDFEVIGPRGGRYRVRAPRARQAAEAVAGKMLDPVSTEQMFSGNFEDDRNIWRVDLAER